MASAVCRCAATRTRWWARPTATGTCWCLGPSAYYRAKYEIDPLNLPSNVQVPNVEQRVAVRREQRLLAGIPGAPGACNQYHPGRCQHRDLPLGSQVRHKQSGALAVVGWDGLVYLENLVAHNTLQVTVGDGQACQATFELDITQEQVPLIGPLVWESACAGQGMAVAVIGIGEPGSVGAGAGRMHGGRHRPGQFWYDGEFHDRAHHLPAEFDHQRWLELRRHCCRC